MKSATAPEKINQAMVTLLNDRPFEKITVAAIVQTAGLNRGTFYLHFDDKYDVIEALENNVFAELQAIVNKAPAPAGKILSETGTRQLLAYLQNNGNLISGLLFSGADIRLQGKLKQIFLQHTHVHTHGLPDIYVKEMLVSHFMSILLLWLERQCVEPADQIASLLDTANMSHDWHQLYD
jgi:AcrR family transcriptional regulator